MPQDINIQDAGGVATTATGSLLYIMDKVQIAQVNDWIVAVTSTAGLIWVIYKILGQRLDNKIKRREYEKSIEDSRK